MIKTANALIFQVLRRPRSERLATVVLWIGLLMPLAIDPARTRSDVLREPLTLVAALRGVIPAVCLAAAFIMTRVPLTPVTRLEKILGVFLGVVLASTFWSVSPSATALKGAALLVVYLTILLLARVAERNRKQSIDQLVIAVHLILLASLIGLVTLRDHAFVRLGHFDATPRLAGVFPTMAPDFLALFAVVGIVALVIGRGPAIACTPIVRWGLVLAYLGIIVLTRTRSALAILGVCIFFIAAILWSRRRLLVLFVSGVLGAVLVATIALGPLGGFLSRNQSGRDLFSLTGRTATWHDALAKWSSRPVLGFGYYAGHRFALVPKPGAEDISNLDNMWIESLIDVGLLGTLPLGALVIAGGIGLFGFRRVESDAILLRRALFVAAFIAGLINPSLELESYPLLVFGLVLFGAPRIFTTTNQNGAEPSVHVPIPIGRKVT